MYLKLSLLWYSNERIFVNIMQISRNTFKMQFKSSVENMKRVLFFVFLAELICSYFRNLIFKDEETGNLLVVGTDLTTGNSYKYF